MNDVYLGEFEQMVLLAILRLGRDAYGIGVIRELEERVGRRVSRGALYITLDRLEEKGLIRSRHGGASPKRGGRPRRYLSVTAAGVRALRKSRATLTKLWEGLESALEETS